MEITKIVTNCNRYVHKIYKPNNFKYLCMLRIDTVQTLKN